MNAQGANGATALINAAYYNFYDVAEILVKYGADKNIKDLYPFRGFSSKANPLKTLYLNVLYN